MSLTHRVHSRKMYLAWRDERARLGYDSLYSAGEEEKS
jgi:hypothetical protein